MKIQDAYDLTNVFDSSRRTVTIERNGASWTGQVVAVVTYPSVLLETEKGRVAIALDGAEIKP